MAKEQTTSNFFKKNAEKLRKIHEEKKGEETTYARGGDVPSGVEGGIARLESMKVDVYKTGKNKGQHYFSASGICVSPQTHKGVVISGLRTFIMEPLHDTPTRTRATVEDHLGWVYNEIRKFGVDLSEVEVDQVEDLMKELAESKPYFSFRTWSAKPSKNDPEPFVNHVWGGLVEWTEEGDPAVDGVDEEQENTEADEGEDAPAEEEQHEAPAPKPKGKTPPPKPQTPSKPVPPKTPEKPTPKLTKPKEPEAPKTLNASEVKILVAKAAKEDTKAVARLTEAAVAAGYSVTDVENAGSWDEVAEMILNPVENNEEPTDDQDPQDEPEADESESSDDDGASEEDEIYFPDVKDIVGYKPLDPKRKGVRLAKVDCEVIKIDKDNLTVDLQNVATKKVYNAIHVGDLIYETEA